MTTPHEIRVTEVSAAQEPPRTAGFHPRELAGVSGLLWAVNRYLFHPRGFALSVEMSSGELTLWGEGIETWRFDDATDEEGMRNFEETLARLREEFADYRGAHDG